jgi:hypothetical protein
MAIMDRIQLILLLGPVEGVEAEVEVVEEGD